MKESMWAPNNCFSLRYLYIHGQCTWTEKDRYDQNPFSFSFFFFKGKGVSPNIIFTLLPPLRIEHEFLAEATTALQPIRPRP